MNLPQLYCRFKLRLQSHTGSVVLKSGLCRGVSGLPVLVVEGGIFFIFFLLSFNVVAH